MDALAAYEEAETEVGRERIPAAEVVGIVEQAVGPAARLIDLHQLNHRRRENAHAVELATPPQHLGETEHVGDSRYVAASRNLRLLADQAAEHLQRLRLE